MDTTPASGGDLSNRFARWLPTGFIRVSVGLHLLGAAALVLVPRRWPLIVGGLVVNHVLIAMAGMWPRSRLLGPNLRRLSDRHAACGEVALTFDDGPDPEATPEVLQILDQRCRDFAVRPYLHNRRQVCMIPHEYLQGIAGSDRVICRNCFVLSIDIRGRVTWPLRTASDRNKSYRSDRQYRLYSPLHR